MRPLDTSLTRVLRFSTDEKLRRRFMVVDRPIAGNLRFGLTLETLDRVAEEAALSYARRFVPNARVVTAAIDGIRVRRPADVTRDLHFLARINFVGRTSMEVGIRVEQKKPDTHVASCYVTMVARNGSKSVEIPRLSPVEPLEHRRAERAVTRRQHVLEQEHSANEPPQYDEFEMLQRLHREQEAPGFEGRLVGDLVATSWEQVYLEQENVPQKIFGGYLIHRAYQLAAIHAEDLSTHRPAVAAVNRINFRQPVRIGDKLRFTSRIVYTGRTSIAVETRIERIGRGEPVSDLTNECIFTFVNVDEHLCPKPVPRVFPTTYDEDARYLAAYRRNRIDAESKETARRERSRRRTVDFALGRQAVRP